MSVTGLGVVLPRPLSARSVVGLFHPMWLCRTAPAKFAERFAHGLIPNPLACLIATVVLAHLVFSMSRMYIVRTVTPPMAKPEVNARAMIPMIVSVVMASVYQTKSSWSTPSRCPYPSRESIILRAMMPTGRSSNPATRAMWYRDARNIFSVSS